MKNSILGSFGLLIFIFSSCSKDSIVKNNEQLFLNKMGGSSETTAKPDILFSMMTRQEFGYNSKTNLFRKYTQNPFALLEGAVQSSDGPYNLGTLNIGGRDIIFNGRGYGGGLDTSIIRMFPSKVTLKAPEQGVQFDFETASPIELTGVSSNGVVSFIPSEMDDYVVFYASEGTTGIVTPFKLIPDNGTLSLANEIPQFKINNRYQIYLMRGSFKNATTNKQKSLSFYYYSEAILDILNY